MVPEDLEDLNSHQVLDGQHPQVSHVYQKEEKLQEFLASQAIPQDLGDPGLQMSLLAPGILQLLYPNLENLPHPSDQGDLQGLSVQLHSDLVFQETLSCLASHSDHLNLEIHETLLVLLFHELLGIQQILAALEALVAQRFLLAQHFQGFLLVLLGQDLLGHL